MRFMLLQSYGEVESDCAPMTEWTPADIKAHIDFQRALKDELKVAARCHRTRTHDLVTHSHNEELLEESGRELTALPHREAALLVYIKSRES